MPRVHAALKRRGSACRWRRSPQRCARSARTGPKHAGALRRAQSPSLPHHPSSHAQQTSPFLPGATEAPPARAGPGRPSQSQPRHPCRGPCAAARRGWGLGWLGRQQPAPAPPLQRSRGAARPAARTVRPHRSRWSRWGGGHVGAQGNLRQVGAGGRRPGWPGSSESPTPDMTRAGGRGPARRVPGPLKGPLLGPLNLSRPARPAAAVGCGPAAPQAGPATGRGQAAPAPRFSVAAGPVGGGPGWLQVARGASGPAAWTGPVGLKVLRVGLPARATWRASGPQPHARGRQPRAPRPQARPTRPVFRPQARS